MAASFRGIEFGERGQGAQTFDAWSRRAEINVLHIPGGGNTVIQTSGLNADTLALKIRCTKAQLASLYGAVGQSGSLVYHYGTRNAFLESIGDVQEILGRETYYATLNLIGM